MNDAKDLQSAISPRSLAPNSPGRLTIFVGACPGVGKTCAMLNAARERQHQGVSVLVGLVETHGRTVTEALLAGFGQLTHREVAYHSQHTKEFDLDSALRQRPRLILIDELAHTNAPGSRHKYRYQDVTELRAAGIDVYTTLDILHLESLNDIVLQITGIRMQECVPDKFIDLADDLVLVDMPAAILIEHLKQDKGTLPEYARYEPDSIFAPDRLMALRELTLREIMQRIDKRQKRSEDNRTPAPEFIINDRLLVLISDRSDHEYLIRAGSRIADKRRIGWTVVWVDSGQAIMREEKARLHSALTLAIELGASTEVLRGYDIYLTVFTYINIHRFNIVLVGPGTQRVMLPLRKRLYQKLIESGLSLEVTVFPPSGAGGGTQRTPATVHFFSGSFREHMYAVFSALIATGFAILLGQWLSSGNLVLIYVLAVIIVGLKHGAGPAMTTVALAFLSFDFFLAQPIFGFFPTQQDDIAAMVFLVIIALLCGPAASHLRRQFILLNESNRYTESLRSLGQKLTVVDTERSVWLTLAGELGRVLQTEVCIIATESELDSAIYPEPEMAFSPVDRQAIEWSMVQAVAAGRFTDTFGTSAWTLFPVVKEDKCIAVAAVRFGEEITSIKPYDRDLIAAMSQQAADAWQRIQLTGKLESAHLKTEVEQLRSALLSSVSHDLKSPLAAMIGAAETLNLRGSQLQTVDRHELTDTILQESRRLESYIQNLLDMTRLGHGTLKIERDWVSVDDIIGGALIRLRRYFPEVQVEYTNNEPAPLLFAQAVLIEQALYNILENAAKFTPPGERVRIWVEQPDNICLINIEDKGPGIPEPLREKIFDMFYAVATGDHKNQNTGMGLAICRGMIAAHGGKVSARAGHDNTGTRFVVELPIDRPTSAEIQ